ncbi:MAG: HEPN domain-containing protein [Chloroflexi bacterium]|nr:HEPN domain-containing protein [Chloroflexota bacterium]
MIDSSELFLLKAGESFQGAENEFANARYNNCANRSYYGCFQAGIAALIRGGLQPTNVQVAWSHAFVQAQFNGQLINRRRQFPASLRQTLPRTFALRQRADYRTQPVSRSEATAALELARTFLRAVEERRPA